ncbi:transient receptor potential channel pyrexia-like [Macrobrachium nipponense]|uniref:transient receptor potential channel pyrexia-like n=1 Tax=Macrobrachium nipponense TaxID=159736 RepID=UPI0030C8345E
MSDGAASSCLLIEDDPEEHTLTETIPPLFLAIKISDVRAIEYTLSQDPKLVNNPKYSGFPSVHYACKHGNLLCLRKLLEHGANVGAYDAFGNTALHLAVYESWHEGVAELLRHGASPDARNEPPKSVREIRSETPLQAALRLEDLTAVSLLLEHTTDLGQLDSDQSTVLHLAAKTRNLKLLNRLLKEDVCRQIVGEKDCLGNSVFHAVLSKKCLPENEITCIEIYRNFIKDGAGMYVDDVNNQGESPIFLAAQLKLPKLVEFLLSANADPTQVTKQGQTLIHAACYSGCATSLSQLLNTGLLYSQVTQVDKKNNDPFYYAVHSCSIDCCELLLENGDHLTRRDSNGITRFALILKQLPSASQLLQRLFDARISLSRKPHHDPDFHIIFDYSVILSEDKKVFQSSLMSEFTRSHLEPLLKHPLLESFLYLKWQKIKPLFYLSVFMYFLYLMTHTLFIIVTFGYKQSCFSNQTETIEMFVAFHVILLLFTLIPDSIILFANFKKYLWHIETYTKAVAIISSVVVLYCVSVPTHVHWLMSYFSDKITPNDSLLVDECHNVSLHTYEVKPLNISKVKMVRYAAAISSFSGWLEFMMLLGRFPIFGVYVLMFTRVAKSIIKFVVAFSSLLIGFSLCFMVLMNESPAFQNFPLSLIKILMMMNGEIEYSTLYEDMQMPVVSLAALALFMFLVCIIMANLLIGLAVSDIPDIQRQGKIRRLAKQAAYLASYDKLITVAHNSRYFPKCLRKSMSHRSNISREESIYPNMNSMGRKFQRAIPRETIHEAILRGNSHDARHDLIEEKEEDINILFKSFKLAYNKDRKLVHEKLKCLPEGVVTENVLKEYLDHLQNTMECRLTQLTLQVTQQLQENQSLVQTPQLHSRHTDVPLS